MQQNVKYDSQKRKEKKKIFVQFRNLIQMQPVS